MGCGCFMTGLPLSAEDLEMCEEAVEIRLVGRSYFVRLRSGGAAFIPVDKICEALKRYGICVPEELKGKCRD